MREPLPLISVEARQTKAVAVVASKRFVPETAIVSPSMLAFRIAYSSLTDTVTSFIVNVLEAGSYLNSPPAATVTPVISFRLLQLSTVTCVPAM